MSGLDRFEILPIVRCIVCHFDVAETDDAGWCFTCRAKFYEALDDPDG